jgi:hypothetical protein
MKREEPFRPLRPQHPTQRPAEVAACNTVDDCFLQFDALSPIPGVFGLAEDPRSAILSTSQSHWRSP